MISVVIPLYNKAHTIESTVQSILSQTFTHYEIIIVNDGSTDNSKQVIEGFRSNTKIKIIDQENQGVSVARNNGIACAKFNYVALLDGDDEWKPTFLEKMWQAIQLYPKAGYYGAASWHHNVITGEQNNSTPSKYKGKISEFDFFENPHIMPHTSAVVINKPVFLNVFPNGEGFPAGMKCCEDWSCFYQIAFLAPVIYVGYPLSVRNNNVKGQVTALSQDERFKLMPYVVNFYNITYTAWASSTTRSEAYLRFLKYELRCRVIAALRTKDFKTISYLLSNINDNCKNVLHNYELFMYPKPSFIHISKYYIYFTKIKKLIFN